MENMKMAEKIALIRLQGKGFLTPEGEKMFRQLFEREIVNGINVKIGAAQ